MTSHVRVTARCVIFDMLLHVALLFRLLVILFYVLLCSHLRAIVLLQCCMLCHIVVQVILMLASVCVRCLCLLGAVILRMRGGTKHSPHLTIPEIDQKSSRINDLENEPGHVWRLIGVSGVTRDDN